MTKPRTSSTYHFLNEEEFSNIPQSILDEAAERGQRGHKLIELNWNTNLDNPIVNMFREGLERIIKLFPECSEKPLIEKQINSLSYTGKPDFFNSSMVIDYKFTRDRLRPETAIQLALYGELVSEFLCSFEYPKHLFAFHFPPETGGLFIYRIPDRAKEPLRKFGLSLVEHYDDIQAGKLVKYDKINEWERLQLEYDVFEPFHSIMPPMEIKTVEQANNAVIKFCTDVKRFEEQKEHFKNEIKRYMKEIGEDNLESIDGQYKIKIVKYDRKQYDIPKDIKEKYYTGTKPVEQLRASKVSKKVKQIN